MATNPNYKKLLIWMAAHYITNKNLGEQLGVSPAYARLLCYQERIPQKWHADLVGLGFPAELLPRAEDIIGAPRAGQRFSKHPPIFPGLQKDRTAQV